MPRTRASLTLASFPEELLERILALCVIAPLYPPARPEWHCSQAPSSSYHTRAAHNATATRGRLAPLLVCKAFHRIATPLFYHTLHLSSQHQLQRMLKYAMYPNPALAWYVRRVVFGGVWAEGGDLLRMCGGIRVLEVTLDVSHDISTQDQGRDTDAKAFSRALSYSSYITHLTIRKPANVYLTQSKPRHVICGIAKAIQNWTHLESAHLAFRLSDDNAPSSSPTKAPQAGPITLLTHALRASPHLHTLTTLVPSLWNESILRVSENPRLERIVLGDGNVDADHGGGGIVGTGLFLMQARKHARLSDLIRAGTPIIRSRAHTMGTVGSPSPSSNSVSVSNGFATPCPPMRKGVSTGSSSSSSTSQASYYPSPSTSHRFPGSEWTESYHRQQQKTTSRSRLLSSSQ